MLEVDEICFILKDTNIAALFVASDKIDVVKDSLKKLKFNSVPLIYVHYMDYIKKSLTLNYLKNSKIKIIILNSDYFQKKWSDILEINDFQFSHINNPDGLCIIHTLPDQLAFQKVANIQIEQLIQLYIPI